MNNLQKIDPQISQLIKKEAQRQKNGLNLIASENFVSSAVSEALASVCTNKYAEGYPGQRYYSGNQYIDEIEKLAQKRAQRLFRAEHVNVQPYSGSPANLAVYLALAQPGDTILGMSLSHGGHLTHGHPVNLSGKLFNFIQYQVDSQTEKINYQEIEKLALKFRPRIIVSGATAYPRIIDFKKINQIAQKIKAISLADISHIAGLVVTQNHPSPLPFTDVVTTTTHKTLRGPRGALIMCKKQYATSIDRMVFPGMQGGPHENNIAAIAVALQEASTPAFQKYSKQIIKNAQVLAQTLQKKGIKLVTNGTDNHLLLVDLQNHPIKGKEAESLLEKAKIYVNKNSIPNDSQNPLNPSGLRIGTPALTTQGFQEKEMKKVGEIIALLLNNPFDLKILKKSQEQVKKIIKIHAS